MAEARSGFALLLQQFRALVTKNMLLSLRNKKATILQLISPLFFIMLIFAIDKSTKAATESGKKGASKAVMDPATQPFPAIPPCESKLIIRQPCYDFVWSGDKNRKFRKIVKGIMRNNPGRVIPEEKVISFKDKAEVDDWLFNNPMVSPLAIHFTQTGKTTISYGIQTNSTALEIRGKREDPTTAFQLPLQLNAEREIARSLIGDPKFSWNFSLKDFAHPATPEESSVGNIGPVFFLAITMFNFVLQLSTLVTEKELKLRLAMNMMGLYDTAYWFSWLIWETVMTLISSLLIVLFGMVFQFPFFLKNNFAVQFLLFFLFALNMTALAFLTSAFVSKSASATRVGFLIFLIGFVTQMMTSLAGFPYSKGFPKDLRILWSFFPPNLFAKALGVLSSAVSTPEAGGIRWSDRGKCPVDDPNCVLTIDDVFMWLLSTFFLWFVLALYFDNIIPNAAGLRKSKLYFLYPGYWTGRGEQRMKEGANLKCCCKGSTKLDEKVPEPDDEDVRHEESAVKRQLGAGVIDENVAVQIRGLKKTYPGVTKACCFCCKVKRTAPYSAVKGLWVNFEKDRLFCLLGPNGAGKTTTISCLTGLAPVTDGDALIYGHSIRSSIGMAHIRRIIGVCPQFDILWDRLSGEEHLRLFALLKGLPPSSIETIVQTLLAEVQLAASAKVRSGSYSGGMKRRISVAIALIGDPKLVILDEPTTGMDPITRRHVWDVIERAKKGRAIVLTTHSMEEADILSDRIAIVAKGRLRCIGTSIRLKSRFGAGFIATISFKGNNNEDAVSSKHCKALKKFFKDHLDVKPKEENNSFLTYVIPHEKEEFMAEFFSELQDREEEFGISDIQLGLTTLEDVFLNIARQAELETAAAEGRVMTLTLTSGESAQIPVGARFVGIPGTECEEFPRGFMVEVYWEQDENGALCIGGNSEKIAVPPGVQLPSPPPAGSVHGVVIDPNQVS